MDLVTKWNSRLFRAWPNSGNWLAPHDEHDLRHLNARGGFVIGLSPKGTRAERGAGLMRAGKILAAVLAAAALFALGFFGAVEALAPPADHETWLG
jgi:hypothetical protein